jgi:hypothetical protein
MSLDDCCSRQTLLYISVVRARLGSLLKAVDVIVYLRDERMVRAGEIGLLWFSNGGVRHTKSNILPVST